MFDHCLKAVEYFRNRFLRIGEVGQPSLTVSPVTFGETQPMLSSRAISDQNRNCSVFSGRCPVKRT